MIYNRFSDLENLISGVDITPTMYRNAREKYLSLGKFFKDNNIECDIYPQGSFALGTVIKPLKNGVRSEYDLDFICLLKYDPSIYTAKEIRDIIKKALINNKVYKEMFVEENKCLTLKYAEINNLKFNIDILPSINDIENFILITHKLENSDKVDYFKANPKDYIKWFEDINSKYPQAKANGFLLESIQDNTIESIPDLFDRTSLQRVIQILKFHRDYYYNHIKKDKKKIISAIITTLCAQIAENINNFNYNVEDLLKKIIIELGIYSEHLILSPEAFDKRYTDKQIIKKSFDKWTILNPVNSDDNLADQWNEDSEKAKLFFQWIDCLKKDFLTEDDKEYFYSLRNIFGESYLNSKIDISKFEKEIEQKKEVPKSTPWRVK